MARSKLTYVLLVRNQNEYDRLHKMAKEKYPDAIIAQAIETARLTDEAELVCGFCVGNGNIRDAQGNQTMREDVLTDPVAVSKHWTKGTAGRLGKIRLADFLSDVSSQTANRNANVRHYNDELTIGYG